MRVTKALSKSVAPFRHRLSVGEGFRRESTAVAGLGLISGRRWGGRRRVSGTVSTGVWDRLELLSAVGIIDGMRFFIFVGNKKERKRVYVVGSSRRSVFSFRPSSVVDKSVVSSLC